MKYIFLFEKFLENNYSPLYHYTNMSNLYNIIKTNILKTHKPYIGEKCISFSRNPIYKYDDSSYRPRLKLDQNKLRLNGYKPIPINEFGKPVNNISIPDFKPSLRKYDNNYIPPQLQNYCEWEYEERIYKDIKNINKYIISIQFPNNVSNIIINDFLENHKSEMKKYPDIKIELYDIDKRWLIEPYK